MNAVAGAIVVLAGAVVGGAGAVAVAIEVAANKPGGGPGVVAMVVGAVVGLLGLVLLLTAPREARRP